MKKIIGAGFAALALAVTGACSEDDANVDADLSADTSGDEAAQEYCEFSAELDTRQEQPSEADFDRIVEVAPEEIKDDVVALTDAIKAGEVGSDEATAAAERLEAWEDENCDAANDDAGAGGDDGGSGDDSQEPSSGEPGEAGGDDGSGGNQGSGDDGGAEEEGGAEAEVEAEVGDRDGGGDTSTSR